MLESLLFILGILIYTGIFLTLIRETLKNLGVNPAIFDFLFILFSSLVVLLPSPPELEPSSRIVIEQVRCGGSDKKLTVIQKVTSFFIPNSGSSKPEPQCPAPDRTQTLKFAKGSGSSSGNGGGSNQHSQDVPLSNQCNSDEDFYRYDANQDTKEENEECSLEDNPVRVVNEEKLSENTAVKKMVKKALRNQDVKKEYGRIKRRLEERVHPKDITKKCPQVGNGIYLIKGDNGRYLIEFKSDNAIDILGIGYQGDTKNMNQFENLMNQMYDVDIKGYR